MEQKEKVKRYLKSAYYEGTPEDAIDALVDILYAEDVDAAAQEMRKKFADCLAEDEQQYGQDIYKVE